MISSRSRAAWGALFAGAALAWASCGDPEPYDTSCSADAECVIVPLTSGCGCSTCRATVLNERDVDRFKEDRADADSECDDEYDAFCAPGPAGSCPTRAAFCANGRCALR